MLYDKELVLDTLEQIRDILSHHYFDLDAVVIFDICNDEIKESLITIKQIIKDINKK
jgi:uncharacterized protein with HEPN domain